MSKMVQNRNVPEVLHRKLKARALTPGQTLSDCLLAELERIAISSGRAEEAIADLADLDLHRHAHTDFLGRAWRLRDNITAYDAVYVALRKRLKRRW